MITDATPTQTPRFCGSCGKPLVPNSKFCESCGAPADGRQAPARPVNVPPPAAPVQPYLAYSQPYPPPYTVPQPASRSPLTRWLMIGAGAVMVIVLLIIAISAFSGGGGGSGPSLNEVKSAKFMTGSIDEIIRSERCTLTDVDKSRGYERKWIVSYRTAGKYAMVYTHAFVYDGYQWERYIQAYPKTGCPSIE